MILLMLSVPAFPPTINMPKSLYISAYLGPRYIEQSPYNPPHSK
jgi:hypothetical protein